MRSSEIINRTLKGRSDAGDFANSGLLKLNVNKANKQGERMRSPGSDRGESKGSCASPDRYCNLLSGRLRVCAGL